MIVLQIVKTAKDYHPKAKWYQFANEEQTFQSLESAEQWINDTYGKSKRKPMFQDIENKPKKIGYVIGFRNEEYENGEWRKFLQQDWISFHTMEVVQI